MAAYGAEFGVKIYCSRKQVSPPGESRYHPIGKAGITPLNDPKTRMNARFRVRGQKLLTPLSTKNSSPDGSLYEPSPSRATALPAREYKRPVDAQNVSALPRDRGVVGKSEIRSSSPSASPGVGNRMGKSAVCAIAPKTTGTVVSSMVTSNSRQKCSHSGFRSDSWTCRTPCVAWYAFAVAQLDAKSSNAESGAELSWRGRSDESQRTMAVFGQQRNPYRARAECPSSKFAGRKPCAFTGCRPVGRLVT